MIEFIIILATILTIASFWLWAKCWSFVLASRQFHRDKFFETAHTLISSDSITKDELSRISFYSKTLNHPKSMDIVIEALDQVVREKRSGGGAASSVAKTENREQWLEMTRHWSLTVMSQPTYKGLVAFSLLMKITTLTDKKLNEPDISKLHDSLDLKAA
ncbi:hypothetical protein WH95_18400 [Kiloniella litopenaei]|uniref:Uncharacterized protein n=1 Tax=Kiloniella litopenaei TaxID=1549748 RepID=A0A0M2R4P4_9PROT|nr:hypothetical protein [Kiloniella litopenaei]KKJ75414.1 hypothetical protein WH95_18400 [Kiloniella litopenaei]